MLEVAEEKLDYKSSVHRRKSSGRSHGKDDTKHRSHANNNLENPLKHRDNASKRVFC